MKRTIFRHTLGMGAAVLLVSMGAGLLLGSQETEAWMVALTAAVILLLVLAGALLLSRKVVQPVSKLSAENPEDTYPELQPLVDKLREQNRTIRYQMDELRHRVREFSALTEHMSEGFLLLDKRGTVIADNHSARELLHTKKGELMRHSDLVLRQSVDTALAGAHAEHLLRTEERVYRVVADPVRSSGQVAGAVVLLLDVTEQEQRDALRREFSANVSHELKTPLTTISGFAELMQQGLVPPEKVGEFAGDIYRECRRLVALVDDIIKLSRLDEGVGPSEQEWVNLQDVCAEVLAQLEVPAQQRKVTLQLYSEEVQVYGLRRLLQEMVYNLCENAIKYNKEGGSVTVHTALRQGVPCLVVSDTGIGIPYAHQSRVFERFYRVDKSHSKAIGGTGLGLSIVKRAVQYHNARLELRSQPEQGTEITVWFDGPVTERSNV